MTRARRVHRRERTQSEVPLEGHLVLDVLPDSPVVVRLPEADLDRVVTARICKSCGKHELAGDVVYAPSGTAHLSVDGQVTLCGREIGDGWS